MSDQGIKLCNDCRHCNWVLGIPSCEYPDNKTESLITGKVINRYGPEFLRQHDMDDTCGPQGKWFERKED